MEEGKDLLLAKYWGRWTPEPPFPVSRLVPIIWKLLLFQGKREGEEGNKKDFPPPFPYILFPDSRASEVLRPPRLRW